MKACPPNQSAANALSSSSPIGFADAGFWPVISLPDTTTFGYSQVTRVSIGIAISIMIALTAHASAAFVYFPPRFVISSSSRKGMDYQTLRQRRVHDLQVWPTCAP